MKRILSFFLLPMLALSACVSDKANVKAKKEPAPATIKKEEKNHTVLREKLKNTTWNVVSVLGCDAKDLPPQNSAETAKITFNSDATSISGFTGDNIMGGNVAILDSGFFRAFGMYTTSRLGDWGLCQEKFLAALHRANKIKLQADTLKLLHEDLLLVELKIKENK